MEYKEFPKYVYKGQLLAMVRDKEEQARLPGWKEAPDEDFCFDEANHFNTFDVIPEEHVRKFHEPAEDDTIIPGVSPKLDALPVVPEATPNPAAERRAKVAAERKAAAAKKIAAKKVK